MKIHDLRFTCAAAAAVLACVAGLPAMAQSERAASNESKIGYAGDLERATADNTDYRRVLYTGKHTQLVVMSLQAGQDIGQETHEGHDQFVRIESGSGLLTLGDEKHRLEAGSALVIPAGVEHNISNVGSEPLQLYTLYSPPEHPPGTVQATKPAH